MALILFLVRGGQRRHTAVANRHKLLAANFSLRSEGGGGGGVASKQPPQHKYAVQKPFSSFPLSFLMSFPSPFTQIVFIKFCTRKTCSVDSCSKRALQRRRRGGKDDSAHLEVQLKSLFAQISRNVKQKRAKEGRGEEKR
jgi:hypothetical protein